MKKFAPKLLFFLLIAGCGSTIKPISGDYIFEKLYVSDQWWRGAGCGAGLQLAATVQAGFEGEAADQISGGVAGRNVLGQGPDSAGSLVREAQG